MDMTAKLIMSFRIDLYFTVAGFGDLRDDNDPNCTYEGENNVLLQQASNWLLSGRKNGCSQFAEISPLQSAKFLQSYDTIMKQKCNWKTAQEALDTQSKIIHSFFFFFLFAMFVDQ